MEDRRFAPGTELVGHREGEWSYILDDPEGNHCAFLNYPEQRPNEIVVVGSGAYLMRPAKGSRSKTIDLRTSANNQLVIRFRPRIATISIVEGPMLRCVPSRRGIRALGTRTTPSMRVENELGVSVITLSWHRKRPEGRLPIYRAEVRVLVGAEDLGDDDTLLVACLAWHLSHNWRHSPR